MPAASILKLFRNFLWNEVKYSTDETLYQMCNTIFDDVIHRYFSFRRCFFNIWNTWMRSKTKKTWTECSVDRVYLSEPPMWTVLNETNRKQTEQFHQIIENESWKNCCTIKINKQLKHTHINNLRWWKVSFIEYLVPIKRKFLIIFNIDVAGMG